MKPSPEIIWAMAPNEVFVFGSNLKGIHGAGAARFALERFGAKYGVGAGPTGRCYAIPTKDEKVETLPLERIKTYITIFLEYAKHNQDKIFLVTAIGCGYAGYEPKDIAPMFKEVPPNVQLPAAFIKLLN